MAGGELRAVVEQELVFVLAHRAFVRSPGLSGLLRYLVGEELSGRGEELKETVIGHAHYRREADYDTKLDSVVRVNANRLRLKLEELYAEHPERQIRIVLRRGVYAPAFERGGLRDEGEEVSAAGDVLAVQAAAREAVGDERHAGQDGLESGRGLWKGLRWPLWAAALAASVAVVAVWKVVRAEPVRASEYWSARSLSHLGGSQQFPELSPDGETLLFVWQAHPAGKEHVYLQRLDTDQATRLSQGDEQESRPAWSPDGRRVAFLRFHAADTRKDLVVRELGSGAERTVAELTGTDPWLCATPRVTWSRDGSELFTSTPAPGESSCSVAAVNVKSGGMRWLTHQGANAIGDLEAAVSPDGKTLAFARLLQYGRGDIFLMSSSGEGAPYRLTHDQAEIMGLDWEAGGEHLIAASRKGDGVQRLWRYDLDGHALGQLTDGTSVAAFPRVTPGGERVVFTKYQNSAAVVELSSQGVQPLVSDQSRNSSPRQSADGRYFLYSTDRNGSMELRASDWGRTEQWRVTPRGATVGSYATWSPDGREVAYECRTGLSNICVIASDGSGTARQMTTGTGNNILPSWSHDGEWLYYSSDRTGTWQIYRQRVAAGPAAQITTQGGKRALESPDGKYLFVHRGDPDGGVREIVLRGSEMPRDDGPVLLPELTAARWSDWDVGSRGLYFVRPAGRTSSSEIAVLDPATGRIAKVAEIRDVPASLVHYVSAREDRFLIDEDSDLSEVEITERRSAGLR